MWNHQESGVLWRVNFHEWRADVIKEWRCGTSEKLTFVPVISTIPIIVQIPISVEILVIVRINAMRNVLSAGQ